MFFMILLFLCFFIKISGLSQIESAISQIKGFLSVECGFLSVEFYLANIALFRQSSQ